MKISYCSRHSRRPRACRLLIGALGWAIIFFASAPATAAEKAPAAGAADSKKVHVTADRLVVKSKSNTAEFIGNVHVSQGDMALKADRITIYAKKSAKGGDAASPDMESIDRLVAKGNVEITMKDGKAVTSQAEYQVDKRVMTLSGPGSKVVSGGNSITGSKITLYRDDGRINVDSSGSQRVKAVFISEERLME